MIKKFIEFAALTVFAASLQAASVEDIKDAMNAQVRDKVAESEENGRPYGIPNFTVAELLTFLTSEQSAAYTYAVMDTLDVLEDLNVIRLICIPKGTSTDQITDAALAYIPNAYLTDPDAPAAMYIGMGLYNRFACR
jgi:hypothetical protein